MLVARLVLEYLDALKWPLLAGLALLIFRDQTRNLIDRIRSMKATVGGNSVEVAAERAVQKAAEAMVEPELVEELLAGAAGGPSAGPGDVEVRGGLPGGAEDRSGRRRVPVVPPELRKRLAEAAELRRRQEIERLIETAVEYGWLVGMDRPGGPRPYPVVEWSEDGKPRIAFTTTDPKERPAAATMRGKGTLSA